MSYFTAEQEQQKMFTQLPKALLYEEQYKKMTNDSKVLYSFLIDRVSLSLKNNYIDELGRVYVKCSEITMGEILNKSEKTARKFKNELIDHKLLEPAGDTSEKTKYYVKQPQVTVANLEQYVEGFQKVVNEKTNKENERNKEYRLKVAQGKIKKLKQQFSNGTNDRSIENTGFENELLLNPLETLATDIITDCDQSKVPFSNNELSNTDLLGMYVCTGEPAYINSTFVNLCKEHQIQLTKDGIEILECYEEVFDYELFEYLFLEILNKFRNGRVSNFEKYLITTLDGQSSRKQFTLVDYLSYKQDFNTKNYKQKDYKTPKKNTKPNVKSEPKKETPAPIAPEVEPQKAEELPTFVPKFSNSDYELRVELLKYRQTNELMDNEFSNHTLAELKEVVAEKERKLAMVEIYMKKYNADVFDEETRRSFAMNELGL